MRFPVTAVVWSELYLVLNDLSLLFIAHDRALYFA